jgi:hypothetical protein
MYRHIIHFVVQAYKSPAVSSVTTCRSYIRCCRRCYHVVWRMETHTCRVATSTLSRRRLRGRCPLYHIFIYGDHYFCNIVYPPFERRWYNWFKRQAIAFAFEYKQPNTAQIYFSINVVVSRWCFSMRGESFYCRFSSTEYTYKGASCYSVRTVLFGCYIHWHCDVVAMTPAPSWCIVHNPRSIIQHVVVVTLVLKRNGSNKIPDS